MSNYQQALKIVKRLRQEGYEALFAGGCVRDKLLECEAKDYDVVTNAVPDEIIKLFRRTLKIGAKFGVIMVLMEGTQTEVATFRTEGGYQDGRRPGFIEFASAKEDASRRDFTINGMFHDPVEETILDFVEGQKDLKAGIIRTIGDPPHRFGEDYLRMLRAIRFASRLNFQIEKITWDAICQYAPKISQISVERIAAELEMILTDPACGRGAGLLIESGLAQAVFPEVSKDEFQLSVKVVEALNGPADYPLAISAFFTALDSALGIRFAEQLKLSNARLKQIRFLLENRGTLLKDMSTAELRLMLAEPYYDNLYRLQHAICKVHDNSTEVLEKLKERAEEIPDRGILPPPLLDGNDLLSLGVPAGPTIGQVSRQMFLAQLAGQIATADQARQWVRTWLENYKSK